MKRMFKDRNDMELFLAGDIEVFLRYVELADGDVGRAQSNYFCHLLARREVVPGDLALYNECMYDV